MTLRPVCAIAMVALACLGCGYDAVLGTAQAGGSGIGGATLSPDDAARLDHPIEPGPVSGVDVVVTVRTDDPRRHAISPKIYGIRGNTDYQTNRQSLFSPAQVRWSTYDWENNASNSGYSSGQNDSGLSGSDTPGDAVRTIVQAANQSGAEAVVVVPIGARVAADKFGTAVIPPPDSNPSNDLDYLSTRFDSNSPEKGAPLELSPDLSDHTVYQDEFLHWLAATLPSARVSFALDDEPDLWRTTMPAARPEILTYGELAQRNVDFGLAVKRIWPDAVVFGLTSYGWSGWERLEDPVTGQQPSDASGPFLDYYLARMQAAETEHGVRIIDDLDLHWISEARGPDASGKLVRTASQTDAVAGDARIQAPRSLWDPTYLEDSWIVNDVIHGPIQLIPRIRTRIAAAYPGTRLSIGSWLFGGDTDISGAIAVADTLGIFGREDVDAAALLRGTSFALLGFRIFTDYDGSGGHFGNFSIAANTSDVAASSAYASVDASAPDRVVIVLINKRAVTTRIGVRLAHPTMFSRARVLQLDGTATDITSGPDVPANAPNAFVAVLQPRSIEVLIPTP